MIRRLFLQTEGDWLRELDLINAAPDSWNRIKFRSSILVFRTGPFCAPAANIVKQTMLSAGGEAIVSRHVISCQCESTDAVLLGMPRHFLHAAESLLHQPFGLEKLADEIHRTLSKVLSGSPGIVKNIELKNGKLEFGEKPLVMGILNVTPDSFSDGGKYLEPEAACRHAVKMIAEGADIIDIGAESTRPGSDSVSPDEQIKRLIPVIEAVRKRSSIPLSVDTSSHDVADRAIQAGVDIVNDVTALSNPAMVSLISSRQIPVILMHMKGSPATMQDNPEYTDCIGNIYSFLEKRITFAIDSGIRKDLIIVDPGIGFGKRFEDNIRILRRLPEFRWLGVPLMLGHSRKSFLGEITGENSASGELRDRATHVISGIISPHVDILRVHNVSGTVESLKVSAALFSEREKDR